MKLASLARVPRSHLRKFENGEGITLTTFMKLAAQLPNLERLTLGPTDQQLQNVDLQGLGNTLTKLIAAAAGVLAVLQSASPRGEPPQTKSADAVRHHPTVTEGQRAEALNASAVVLSRGAKAPADQS